MGNSFSNATLLIENQNTTITISPDNPNYYFVINTTIGEFVTVRTSGNDLDTYMYLYDDAENEIASDDDAGGGYNSLISFVASETSYYVMVRGYSTPSVPTETSVLFTSEVVPYIEGTTFEDAILLQQDRNETIAISQFAPNMYFRLNTIVGEKYTVQTYGNDLDTYGFLYDRNRNEIDSNDDGGEGVNTLITFTATDTLYYFMVRGYDTPSVPKETIVSFTLSDSSRVEGVRMLNEPRVIRIGESFQIDHIVFPVSATNKEVVWHSEDENIITVTDGLITGVGLGRTLVQVETVDGNYTHGVIIYVVKWAGQGTKASPYLVSNAEELQDVGRDLQGHFKQTNDIDLNNVLFTPIGSLINNSHYFLGTYDGNGYSIDNLRIDENTQYVGLFKEIRGIVKNLTLNNVDITNAQRYTGGLVGYLDGQIINCHVNGSVNGESYLGGLVGMCVSETLVKNSSFTGTVFSSLYGGSSISGYIGGLIGDISNYSNSIDDVVIIENSFAIADVNGLSNTGGLIGSCEGVIVRNCYAKGTVDGYMSVGGLIGSLQVMRVNAITDVINCYSDSTVISAGSTGGLIGETYSANQVTNNIRVINSFVLNDRLYDSNRRLGYYFAVGDILTGGFSEVTNSYVIETFDVISNREVFTIEQNATGTITAAQTKQKNTYNGWDFVNVWDINENSSHPFLRPYFETTEPVINRATMKAINISILNYTKKG